MTKPPPRQNLHYLAKDYTSFRAMMLDHLAALAPGGTPSDAASLEATLVEALAYVGDYLSYYQDAVATEAYLVTARQRISVRRHARLLDYSLGEGCSARVWVHLDAAADHVPVPRGTALLTKIPQIDAVRVPADYEEGRAVFETLHDAVLMRAHNRMALCDPQTPPQPGQTEARLAESLPLLAPGDVLIFQHSSGGHAHAVRLISASAEAESTVIAWHDDDALPAELPAGGTWTILGNIVLADHGQSLSQPLPPVPDEGVLELSIQCPDLTYALTYRHEEAIDQSATQTMQQDPRAAEPALGLRESAAFLTEAALARRPVWTGRREIIHASQFERSFAVEPTDGAEVRLRFGDGVHGRRLQSDWNYAVRYRRGRGTRGNIGPNTLAHIVIDDDRILGVANPLAGSGGAGPESLDHVRARAPLASDAQRRCVTAADYVAITNLFPGVHASVAVRDWTPQRSAVTIFVSRHWGRRWEEPFAKRLSAYLAAFQLIGDEVTLCGPDYIAPIVALELEVDRSRLAAETVAAVRARLVVDLAFEFGEPLDPDRLIACAGEVPGVIAARVIGIARDGAADSAIAPVAVASTEIIRLDPAHLQISARAHR